MASKQSSEDLELSKLSLVDFKLWSHAALTKFLSLRRKNVNGTDNELAARLVLLVTNFLWIMPAN